jgi:hypothetical protein
MDTISFERKRSIRLDSQTAIREQLRALTLPFSGLAALIQIKACAAAGTKMDI